MSTIDSRFANDGPWHVAAKGQSHPHSVFLVSSNGRDTRSICLAVVLVWRLQRGTSIFTMCVAEVKIGQPLPPADQRIFFPFGSYLLLADVTTTWRNAIGKHTSNGMGCLRHRKRLRIPSSNLDNSSVSNADLVGGIP